jgi:hypothetical protein
MNHVNKFKLKKKQKTEKLKRTYFYKAINSYEIIDTITIILESEYEIVELNKVLEKENSMDKKKCRNLQ